MVKKIIQTKGAAETTRAFIVKWELNPTVRPQRTSQGFSVCSLCGLWVLRLQYYLQLCFESCVNVPQSAICGRAQESANVRFVSVLRWCKVVGLSVWQHFKHTRCSRCWHFYPQLALKLICANICGLYFKVVIGRICWLWWHLWSSWYRHYHPFENTGKHCLDTVAVFLWMFWSWWHQLNPVQERCIPLPATMQTIMYYSFVCLCSLQLESISASFAVPTEVALGCYLCGNSKIATFSFKLARKHRQDCEHLFFKHWNPFWKRFYTFSGASLERLRARTHFHPVIFIAGILFNISEKKIQIPY